VQEADRQWARGDRGWAVEFEEHPVGLDPLAQAVERLYETLQVERLPAVLSGCTLCFTEADEEALRLPPRQVTRDALAQFVGSPSDHYDEYSTVLRRLFPAVADALAAGELHVDAGLTLSRLQEAEWDAWPPAERAAVVDFLQALYVDVLTHRPPKPGEGLFAEELLSGVASATGTLTPWLDVWNSLDHHRTAAHLVSVVNMQGEELLDPDADLYGWWPEGAAVPLRRWLCQDWIEQELLRLGRENPNAQVASATAIVRQLRQREAAHG
jgi:hypothetical protein